LSTLLPLAAIPYCQTSPVAVLSISFAALRSPLQPSVDSWLLCCLLHFLLPDVSFAAFVIVRLSTLLPPAAIPYRQTLPVAVLSITFAAPVDGWLLHYSPTQQHTN